MLIFKIVAKYKMFFHLTSIIAGVMYSHLMEWVLHKYVLHGLGKKKNNIFSFHWKTHHKIVRKDNFYDYQYEDAVTGGPLRERLSLYALLLAHTPLIMIAPAFFAALVFCSIRYYRLHKRMHLDPTWAKYYFPGHWEHHMGKDQDKNWGVTIQWVDKLFKTSTL